MIGAARYWSPRQWAPRYWMKVGADSIPLPRYRSPTAAATTQVATTKTTAQLPTTAEVS